ncbi:60 kDa lysophospholipase-like isoform X2 [Carcharodon carcharias]|nr:60 kDa lysophospholipase-like isoform X2 [Carcharodon carcharias]
MSCLHDENYAQEIKLYDCCDSSENTLVLPLSKLNKRVIYTIIEYSPLLDSCNMTTDEWIKIAIDIKKNYKRYNGFVILHGTDTMAYTAAALSFMCENQGKPIILTGSQVPIYEMRNDGHDNLLGALLIAGQYPIPEVCLYFQGKLYRGNRVTKVDAESYMGFSSPNMRPLAEAEVKIKVNWDIVWRPKTAKEFRVQTNMNQNVGLMKLYPGFTCATVRAFLQPPMEGIVLETYGTGNAPDNFPKILEEFKNAIDHGMLMINCTQCLRGSVSPTYATGMVLTELGIIPGCDMTPEAALIKLSYVLGKTELSIQEKKKMLSENLRGELGTMIPLQDKQFIQDNAKSLAARRKEEQEAIRDVLTTSSACVAAKAGDVDALEAILDMGGNLCSEDYDGQTPLHVAVCEGHLDVVKFLLSHGVTFCDRDRMAADGDMKTLMAWHLAGWDLDQWSYDGQHPPGI